jgi:hypothetical protein
VDSSRSQIRIRQPPGGASTKLWWRLKKGDRDLTWGVWTAKLEKLWQRDLKVFWQ